MPGSVQSVERAAAMLQLLASQMEPLGLTQIAGALGLPKGTAHGLLRTLVDVGFVVHETPTGRYEVSPDLYRLGASPPDTNELRARALNWTDVLAARTGESASLAVFRGEQGLRIHHVLGSDSDTRSGPRHPIEAAASLHTTALGKILLAFDPGAGRMLTRRDLELPAATHHTITERAALFRELALVRDQGWSCDVDEDLVGRSGIAAPVRDRGGFVVAAVGVEGATVRICDGRSRVRADHVTEVQRAARSVSRELGHGRPG